MEGGNTTLLAGAIHPDRSRAAASGLGAHRSHRQHVPSPLTAFSDNKAPTTRSPPCGLETSAKLLRHGCSLMPLNGTKHSDRWLTGVGATPTRALCIARKTPLAPVRDAPIVPRKSRVPACVRSRWGRVTSPTPQDMSKHDFDTVQDTDSTAPDTPTLDAYPAGPNHGDLLLCGPENDTQWIKSDTHVDLTETI